MAEGFVVSDTVTSSSPVTVHGLVVGQVSPLKTSKSNSGVKYFNGSFTDGKKTLRMVSFDPKLRDQFEEAQKSCSPVALRNCVVKRSRTDELEILVNTKSSLIRSPKKFKVTEDDAEGLKLLPCPVVGTLEEIKDIAEHQQVTITGKVLSALKPEEITIKTNGKRLKKQEFAISDGTAALRGVAWENHIDTLEEGMSYKICSASVRSFNGAKYLSVGERSTVEVNDDIGDVVEESIYDGSGDVQVIKGEIIGVVNCESYASCKNCDGKVVQFNQLLGKCSATLKMARCSNKKVARVILVDLDGSKYKLTLFDEVINQIIDFAKEKLQNTCNCDLQELLLSAPDLIYTFTSKEVVSSVTKIINGDD